MKKIKDLDHGYYICKISKSRYAVFAPSGKSLEGEWRQFRSIKSAEISFYQWYYSWNSLPEVLEEVDG